MTLFKLTAITSAIFLTACGTLPKHTAAQNGDTHPRGGTAYLSCTEAADALALTFDQDAVAQPGDRSALITYMAPDGPRCDVSGNVFAVNKHGLLRTVYEEKKITRAGLKDVRLKLIKYLNEDTIADKKILLFSHGGLIAHRPAISEAEIVAPWATKDGYFPIFLVWDSSLNSTYWDYLFFTTDGERNNDKLDAPETELFNDDNGGNDDGFLTRSILATTRVFGDLGTGVFKAPENYVIQFDNYWERNKRTLSSPYRLNPTDFGPLNVEQNSLGSTTDGFTKPIPGTLVFPELAHLMDTQNLDINAGKSWASPGELPYHALTPVRGAMTGLSEVGRNSWDNMVRRTRLSMYAPGNFSSPDRFSPTTSAETSTNSSLTSISGTELEKNICEDVGQDSTGKDQPLGGFALGMEMVSCVLKEYENRKNEPAKITLSGHSMGAIVANEILWDYPDLNYDKIIYMAAAGSMRDFNRIALPVIRDSAKFKKGKGEPETEFYSLMLHPLAEARERIFRGVPPQGSLLEWIDEMFEGPRNFEEKTLGKYRNISRWVGSYDEEDQELMTFRVFPIQAEYLSPLCDNAHIPTLEHKRCHPLTHGEVNDFTFWRQYYHGDIKE